MEKFETTTKKINFHLYLPQPSFFSGKDILISVFSSLFSVQQVWNSPLHGWNSGSGLSSSPNLQINGSTYINMAFSYVIYADF